MTRKERAKDYAEHNIDKYTNDFANLYNAYLKGAKEETKELEQENAELKCECRRCVHTDCPCVLSDFGKTRNGICDHFKDVFDENVELKEELNYSKTHCLFHSNCPTQKELEGFRLKVEALEDKIPWKDIRDKSEVIEKLIKAKELLREYIRINLLPPIERKFDDEVKLFKQAEQFLIEVK